MSNMKLPNGLIDTTPYFYYDEKRRIPVYGVYAETYKTQHLEPEIVGSSVVAQKKLKLDPSVTYASTPVIDTKTSGAKPV